MLRRLRRSSLIWISLAASLATLAWLSRPVVADDPIGTLASALPVEKSMHEFMEYVFEPGYKRLKANLAAAPADNAGWKAIKGDALVLAEATNLLFDRLPEEKSNDWIEHAAASRAQGALLYQAAKKKDYTAARAAWETMLTKCNGCHKQFADGEHQLAP